MLMRKFYELMSAQTPAKKVCCLYPIQPPLSKTSNYYCLRLTIKHKTRIPDTDTTNTDMRFLRKLGGGTLRMKYTNVIDVLNKFVQKLKNILCQININMTNIQINYPNLRVHELYINNNFLQGSIIKIMF